MDYFNSAVKYDPVNYYILFTKEELMTIKHRLSLEEISKLKNDLKCLDIDYQAIKRSIVSKKRPPNVKINDYVSLATYYWPNPETFNGLPYILKDGMANPEGKEYDKDDLRELAFIVYYKVLLYYLTDEVSYYDDIRKNIYYYILDKKTGMNPNMDHAQMIKGKCLGRGIGMIDFTANFSYAIYMLKLLKDDNKIDNDFNNDLSDWLRRFMNWYKYSPIAMEELRSANNHGIFYDFGLAIISDFLGVSKEIVPLSYSMIERMNKEIEPDGKMPLEQARTKSKCYSLMAAKGLYDFSLISRKYSFDLYESKAWSNNRCQKDIKPVINFLINGLVLKTEPWPYKQIIEFDETTLLPLIHEAVKVLGYNYSELRLHLNLDKIKFKMLLKLMDILENYHE